jgi:hypothetical protein
MHNSGQIVTRMRQARRRKVGEKEERCLIIVTASKPNMFRTLTWLPYTAKTSRRSPTKCHTGAVYFRVGAVSRCLFTDFACCCLKSELQDFFTGEVADAWVVPKWFRLLPTARYGVGETEWA